MRQTTIDIILPAYFEQENIKKVITGIEKYVKTPHKITVVLQDKHDPTLPVVTSLIKITKSLNIIVTKNGKGMLKALSEGFKRTKAPIIVIMMADLSDNPKDIDKMVAKINNGADLVCASRYMPQGKRIGGPKVKGLLSYIACFTLHTFIRIPTTDATNAFKCVRRTLIDAIKIESKEGFEMPLELSVKAFHLGFVIADIPTTWRDRESGKSKFKLWQNLALYTKWYIYAITHRNTLSVAK